MKKTQKTAKKPAKKNGGQVVSVRCVTSVREHFRNYFTNLAPEVHSLVNNLMEEKRHPDYAFLEFYRESARRDVETGRIPYFSRLQLESMQVFGLACVAAYIDRWVELASPLAEENDARAALAEELERSSAASPSGGGGPKSLGQGRG